MRSRVKTTLLALFAGGMILLAVLLASSNTQSPKQLMGRILDSDEYLRVQVESDFDRDGDIDFLDFTVFSAFYEESA